MPRKGTSLKLEYKTTTKKELFIVFELYMCDSESSQSAFRNETVLRVSFVD